MTSDLELRPDLTPAPTTLFASPDPALIVAEATRVAGVLAPVITDRHLYAPISGKKYPTLEAWTLLGMLMRTTVSPHVTRTWQTDNGWGAHAEARTLDGQVVSAADAYCMRDEEKWANKPDHQVASMASTRACSRAMRLPLSFVMSLTGYEVTPAEEMEAAARGETVSGGKGVQPGWRDIAEQQRAHAELGELIDNLGARQWVIEWCDSKGYKRPLAKGQLNQLRKAIEREFEPSGAGSRATPSAGPTADASPAPDPSTSPPSPTDQEVAPTEADRSGAGGQNQNTEPERDPDPPSGAASTPPGAAGDQPPGRRPPGGTKGGRSAVRPGTATADPATEAADQAAFEQGLANEGPGKWTR
jgi:hypothetical protein